MLIRSQDKLTLLNIEAITTISVGISGLTVDADTDSSSYTLGDYGTIQKAIKVLDMIQKWYAIQKGKKPCYVSTDKRLAEYCFQMPEDSEVE